MSTAGVSATSSSPLSPDFLRSADDLQQDPAVNENQEPNFGSSTMIARSEVVTQKLPAGPLTPRRTGNTEGVLGTVRRELQASEERLAERVRNVERRVEQFRDAAFASMKDMFADLTGVQGQYDRKLSEMGGTVKGVNNELQSLVQRLGGSMDLAQTQRKEIDLQSLRTKMEDQSSKLDEQNNKLVDRIHGLEAMVNDKIHVLQMSFDLLQVNVEDQTPKANMAEILIGQFQDTKDAVQSLSDRTDRIEHEFRQKMEIASPTKERANRLEKEFHSHVDDVDEERRRQRLEMSEIRRALDHTHWAAIIELKEALEKVNEHYSNELKTIKESSPSNVNTSPGRLKFADIQDSDDIQGLLIQEVGELKSAIHSGQTTIQQLVPRLLDACQNGREDTQQLVASVKNLEAMASPMMATFEPSHTSRDDWRSPPCSPPRNFQDCGQDGAMDLAVGHPHRMQVNPSSTSCFGNFLERLATYY